MNLRVLDKNNTFYLIPLIGSHRWELRNQLLINLIPPPIINQF